MIAATLCEEDGERELAYDVFVPAGLTADGTCLFGEDVRGEASTRLTARAQHETARRCYRDGAWQGGDVNDLRTEEIGIHDADGDGRGDSPYARACSFTIPIVAVMFACTDTRTGETLVLAQAVAPAGVVMRGDDPCARMALAEAKAKGTGGAPPEAEAGLYSSMWCASLDPVGLYVPESWRPLVVAGVRDADGDGVPGEVYAEGELLP